MAKTVAFQAPTEIELVAADCKETGEYLQKVFGWDVNHMADWKMSTAKWGLNMQAMIRNESDLDKGRNQRTIFYMTVPDMTKEIKRLEKLGGEVFKDPMVIPNMGSWGYVKVPGDIVLGLWSDDPAHKPPARSITKKPGDHSTATFFEFVNSDAKEAAAFFKKAYGWEFAEMPFHGAPYWYASDESHNFSAGIRHPKKGEKDHDLITYVNVEDLAGHTTKMTKSGAKKVGKVVDYAPHGECQLVAIPGNLSIGLWGALKGAGNSAEKPESSTASAPAGKAGKGRAAKSAALSKINTKRPAEKAKASKKPTKKARKE